MLTRRGILGAGAGAAGLFVLPRIARAAGVGRRGAAGRVLVVVQLHGGNDGFNTVVPLDDDRYGRARPSVFVKKSDALRIDDRNGLHPSLARLRGWYDEGCVAVVHGVGSPDPNLSHFRSQAVWDAGNLAGGASPDGWLGRHYDADVHGDRRVDSSIAMLALGRDTLPLALKSRTASWPAIPSLREWRLRREVPDDAPDAGEPDVDTSGRLARVRDCMSAARRASEELAAASSRTALASYPDYPIAKSLRSAADVVAAGLPVQCVYVTYPGFDTHTSQVAHHARLLQRLDLSLHVFLSDLKAQGNLDRVVVATVSEFGRRPLETGLAPDAGTDHGTASCLFVVGGRVRGGIHGEQPDLGDLDPDGNVKHRVDFRSVYAPLVEDWLGGSAERVLGPGLPRLDLVRS